MRNIRNRTWLLFAVALLLAGCAAPKAKERFIWPPPPNEPRLEFIQNYYSQNSFSKTGAEKALEVVAGQPPAIPFRSVTGIASDGKGLVYVADRVAENVLVYDFNSREVSVLSDSPLGALYGMAVDAAGRLFVVDQKTDSVLVFSAEHKPLYAVGGPELLKSPMYVAINDRLGRLYVSDVKGHKIEVFDLAGTHLFTFGESGSGEGQFFGPGGLAIDAQDRVFICDTFNARIQVFDADGKFLHAFGQRGDSWQHFEAPKDIAIDSAGNLYVLDSRKAAMFNYAADGKLLLATGGKPTADEFGFMLPFCIWIDATDRIYVGDLLARRFGVWQYLNEEYLARHPVDPEYIKELEERTRQLMEGTKGKAP